VSTWTVATTSAAVLNLERISMRNREYAARTKLLIDVVTLVVVAVSATGTIISATYAPAEVSIAAGFCSVGVAAIIVHVVTDFLL